MFWHSSDLDGCKAVSGWPVSAVMQIGECLLTSSKQSNLDAAVLSAHVMMFQRSPQLWHESVFFQKTSTRPAGVCHLWANQHWVSGKATLSCFLPPKRGRRFPRHSLLHGINGPQCEMNAVPFGWLGYQPFAVVFTHVGCFSFCL